MASGEVDACAVHNDVHAYQYSNIYDNNEGWFLQVQKVP